MTKTKIQNILEELFMSRITILTIVMLLFLFAGIIQTFPSLSPETQWSALTGGTVAFGLCGIYLICTLLFKFMKIVIKNAKAKTREVFNESKPLDAVCEKMKATYTKIVEATKEPASEYYEQAEKELNDGTFDKGLWAKALVKAKGNEVLRKPEYIKLRAKQLQNNQ